MTFIAFMAAALALSAFMAVIAGLVGTHILVFVPP